MNQARGQNPEKEAKGNNIVNCLVGVSQVGHLLNSSLHIVSKKNEDKCKIIYFSIFFFFFRRLKKYLR